MNLSTLNRAYPKAPWEFQEVVELWARGHGRTAKLHYAPNGTWFVRLSLRSNDPRMLAYVKGAAHEPPTEDVWIHVPNPHEGKVMDGLKQGPFIPIPLEHLGVTGLRAFLEQGDTWSGRGQYLSLIDQLRKVRQDNEDARLKHRADQKEANRFEQRERRRFRFKIPFLPVGIDLRASKGADKEQDT